MAQTPKLAVSEPHGLMDVLKSVLAFFGLEKANIVPDVNSTEITPKEPVSWAIYGQNYFQLKGKPKDIGCYNSKTVK